MVTCKNCSRAQRYKLPHTGVFVCEYCHTLQNDNLGLIRPLVQEDFSLLAPGSQFSFENRTFVITGRIRIQLDNDFVNYWSATSGEQAALLAESYDSYRVLLPEWKEFLGDTSSFVIGTKVILGNLNYYGEFQGIRVNQEAEGLNLPFPDLLDFTYLQVGTSGTDAAIFLINNRKNQTFYTSGRRYTAEQLQLTGLRTEFNREIPVRTCKHCKKTYEPRSRKLMLAWICPECKTYQHVFKTFDPVMAYDPIPHNHLLPGTKGNLYGDDFEILGVVTKRESVYNYLWTEYMLYSPKLGFRFLSEYEGNWMYIWPVEDFPDLNKHIETYHNGKVFRTYQKNYQGFVVAAEGEFLFDVVTDAEITKITEAIRPPDLVGVETSDQFILGYEGEYISPEEVAKSFQVDLTTLPKKQGPGLLQPFMNTPDFMKKLTTITVVLLAILGLVTLVELSNSSDKMIYQKSYFKEDLPDSSKVFVLPSFTLEGGPQSLTFDLLAPLSNSWFFTEIALINETTQEVRYFSKELEYYYGVDGGESWTEGSKSVSAYISSVPDGNYHVNLYPQFDQQVEGFTVEIHQDTFPTTNIWWIFGFIAISFIIFTLSYSQFNKNKWAESDFSKFDY